MGPRLGWRGEAQGKADHRAMKGALFPVLLVSVWYISSACVLAWCWGMVLEMLVAASVGLAVGVSFFALVHLAGGAPPLPFSKGGGGGGGGRVNLLVPANRPLRGLGKPSRPR